MNIVIAELSSMIIEAKLHKMFYFDNLFEITQKSFKAPFKKPF